MAQSTVNDLWAQVEATSETERSNLHRKTIRNWGEALHIYTYRTCIIFWPGLCVCVWLSVYTYPSSLRGVVCTRGLGLSPRTTRAKLWVTTTELTSLPLRRNKCYSSPERLENAYVTFGSSARRVVNSVYLFGYIYINRSEVEGI